MPTPAALAQADVVQEYRKLRVEHNPLFFFGPPGGGRRSVGNGWASAGSTSGPRAVRALARSLIDLSSPACARVTTNRNVKTKNSARILIYLPSAFRTPASTAQ